MQVGRQKKSGAYRNPSVTGTRLRTERGAIEYPISPANVRTPQSRNVRLWLYAPHTLQFE